MDPTATQSSVNRRSCSANSGGGGVGGVRYNLLCRPRGEPEPVGVGPAWGALVWSAPPADATPARRGCFRPSPGLVSRALLISSSRPVPPAKTRHTVYAKTPGGGTVSNAVAKTLRAARDNYYWRKLRPEATPTSRLPYAE